MDFVWMRCDVRTHCIGTHMRLFMMCSPYEYGTDICLWLNKFSGCDFYKNVWAKDHTRPVIHHSIAYNVYADAPHTNNGNHQWIFSISPFLLHIVCILPDFSLRCVLSVCLCIDALDSCSIRNDCLYLKEFQLKQFCIEVKKNVEDFYLKRFHYAVTPRFMHGYRERDDGARQKNHTSANLGQRMNEFNVFSC